VKRIENVRVLPPIGEHGAMEVLAVVLVVEAARLAGVEIASQTTTLRDRRIGDIAWYG